MAADRKCSYSVSDVIPISVQVVNVIIVGPGSTSFSVLYLVTTYVLYSVQAIITGFAVWIIYTRAKELSSVQANAVKEDYIERP